MNKKEVDNDLQKIDKKVKSEILKLNKKAVEKMSGLSLFDTDPKEVSAIVKEVFEQVGYTEQLTDAIMSGSVQSANLGLGTLGSVSVDKYITHELNRTYDGVKLSSIIRQASKEAEKQVTNIIKAQLKAGTTWKKLAKEITTVDKVGDVASIITDLGAEAKKLGVDVSSLKKEAMRYVKRLSPNGAPTKELKNAYMKVIKAVDSKDTVLIDKALEKAFSAKVNYNAQRISRTEISEAYSNSFFARLDEDEDATGYQWVLSSRHPVTDECDFYAELDNGAGKGVYKKGDFPSLPAHPNCLCSMVPYYDKAPRMTSQASSISFLSKQSESRRAKMIGSENSKNRSRFIDGMRKHGIDLNDKPEKLPDSLIIKKKG